MTKRVRVWYVSCQVVKGGYSNHPTANQLEPTVDVITAFSLTELEYLILL